ncbi:MAG: hypothetical protein H7Y18_03985 [Clostridiaceae bacterium]|nr:hypothetical protein [Clostridiaceae bacterium]
MGTDAYVQCNCFKEGKVKTPPFDKDLIIFENSILDLSQSADDATWRKFIKWKEDACEHRGFHLIYERISNASGSKFFWNAIKIIGIEYFPTINSMWKDGQIQSEIAVKALTELKFMMSKVNKLEGNFLIDQDTKEEYYSTLAGEDEWFYSHGWEFKYRLSDKGFYINNSEDKILFLSSDFKQKVKTVKGLGKVKYNVKFRDVETGLVYKSLQPFSKCINWERKEFYFPQKLSVIKRNLNIHDFNSIGTLEKLFKASIITGNPVVMK